MFWEGVSEGVRPRECGVVTELLPGLGVRESWVRPWCFGVVRRGLLPNHRGSPSL